MNNDLTLEQLRFARAIGATHSCIIDGVLVYLKEEPRGVMSYIDDRWKDVTGCPTVIKNPISCIHDAVKINFAPLDEAGQPVPKADMVNNPPHYQTDNGIECIDAIRAALGRVGFIAYCRGNAIKYGWRAGKKDETAQDLRKAAWYLERAAQEIEK